MGAPCVLADRAGQVVAATLAGAELLAPCGQCLPAKLRVGPEAVGDELRRVIGGRAGQVERVGLLAAGDQLLVWVETPYSQHTHGRELPLCVLGLDGRVELANANACGLFGAFAADLQAQPCVLFAPTAERSRLRAAIESAARGTACAERYTFKRADGTSFGAMTRFEPLYDAEGQVVRLVLTARPRALGRPRQRDQQQEFGLLLRGLAHEFCNLQHVIGSNAAALGVPGIEPEDAEILSDLLTATARATKLVEQLRAVGRALAHEQGGTDLAALVEQVTAVALMETEARIDCDLALPEALPQAVGDELALTTILVNLIHNAFEAMPDGGFLTIRGELLAQAPIDGLPYCAEGYLKLGLQDTGPGFAVTGSERLPPLYRAGKPHPHAGIGLSVARVVVEALGGALLTLPSEDGGLVVLYLQAETESAVEPESKAAAATDPPTSDAPLAEAGARLLVVEDEPLVAKFVERLLRRSGYAVEVVDNGPAAVALLLERAPQFDAILLDLILPGCNGDEVLARLRDAGIELPCVATTGHANDPILERVTERGCHALVRKPYRQEQLLSAVRAVLSRPA